VEEAVQEAADKLKWRKDEPPAFVGLYCAREDREDEGNDGEE
jgi:hypothetical protein